VTTIKGATVLAKKSREEVFIVGFEGKGFSIFATKKKKRKSTRREFILDIWCYKIESAHARNRYHTLRYLKRTTLLSLVTK
jgi:hypothetical protein